MKKYVEFITEKRDVRPEFIQAAARGNNNTLTKSIKNGVDINMKDNDGKTALMMASLNDFLLVVNTLVVNNANVNLQDNYGRTALMMASTKKIFNKIISVPSININLTNKRNETVAMEYLDRNDSLDNMIFYLEKFLEKGADLDIKDINGRNYYEIISYNLSISRNNDRLQTLNKFEKYLMTESSLAQNKLSFRENENEINKDFKLYLRKWDFKTKKQKYNLSR